MKIGWLTVICLAQIYCSSGLFATSLGADVKAPQTEVELLASVKQYYQKNLNNGKLKIEQFSATFFLYPRFLAGLFGNIGIPRKFFGYFGLMDKKNLLALNYLFKFDPDFFSNKESEILLRELALNNKFYPVAGGEISNDQNQIICWKSFSFKTKQGTVFAKNESELGYKNILKEMDSWIFVQLAMLETGQLTSISFEEKALNPDLSDKQLYFSSSRKVEISDLENIQPEYKVFRAPVTEILRREFVNCKG